MNHENRLRLIIKELHDFAKNAHGNPAKVYIRKKTLVEWAEALEEISNERAHRTS